MRIVGGVTWRIVEETTWRTVVVVFLRIVVEVNDQESRRHRKGNIA